MGDRPKLTLVEGAIKQALVASLELEGEQPAENVVDLSMERLERRQLTATEVTPEQLLMLCLRDVERLNVVKCYVTMISDEGDSFTVSNYRAGLSRSEEVAFRSLGMQEALDNWRFGTPPGPEEKE